MILEITLPGFDAHTSGTDHLVKWVSALDQSEVDDIFARVGVDQRASPVGGLINHSDIDYWLPRDAIQFESDLRRIKNEHR